MRKGRSIHGCSLPWPVLLGGCSVAQSHGSMARQAGSTPTCGFGDTQNEGSLHRLPGCAAGVGGKPRTCRSITPTSRPLTDHGGLRDEADPAGLLVGTLPLVHPGTPLDFAVGSVIGRRSEMVHGCDRTTLLPADKYCPPARVISCATASLLAVAADRRCPGIDASIRRAGSGRATVL